MGSGVRLAIVGSTDFADPACWDVAEAIIWKAIPFWQPDVVISGGARGIDRRAQHIAAVFGYRENAPPGAKRMIVHLPRNRRWAPDGFEARNRLIAEDCTHLLAIRCEQSETYGAGWTADYAESIGRRVERRVLPRDTHPSMLPLLHRDRPEEPQEVGRAAVERILGGQVITEEDPTS